MLAKSIAGSRPKIRRPAYSSYLAPLDVGREAVVQPGFLAAVLRLMKPVTHRLAEERSLALHREVARRLKVDPALLETARERVQGWLESGFVSRTWAEA